MRWEAIKREFERDVLENKPVPRLDDDGVVSVEASETFHRIVGDFREAGRAEVRKAALLLGAAVAIALVGEAAFTHVDAPLGEAGLLVARILVLIAVLNLARAFARRRESQGFFDRLEDNFRAVAQEMYENGEYRSIGEDGTIFFDSPEA